MKDIFKKSNIPELSIPSASPLSPCIIEPYTKIDGKVEENKGYIPVSLLIKAIDDDRMLNIAVAGNYGVGKSSIINSAEEEFNRKLFPKHRFIKVSLASLLTQENKQKKEQNGRNEKKEFEKIAHDKIVQQGPEQTKDTTKNDGQQPSVETGVSDKQIEYSILQQLLYHDRPQTTPKSRFRRIHKTCRMKPYWIAFLCILVFLSLVLLIKPSWFSLADYYDMESAGDGIKAFLQWGPFIVLGIVFILACRYVSRHYSFSVARVGYKDIEMKVKEEMSIFNAYMDEIVYFFESTRYDVVVFEDLDRFENREIIFYKLRELNTILNNSRSIRQKVNFVYAVLDDLFDSTERVKFFDYIITVIPVINSLNSYEKLKESIKPVDLFEKLGRNELYNLCDYLQDMRLLLNIVNEFNQFVPLLDTAVMSEKILFGIIVYKNYVPSDFALMYNKDGVMATAIEQADVNRAVIISGIQKDIEEKREAVTTIREEYKQKLIDLRKLYLEKGKALSNYASNNLNIRIGNNTFLFDKVAEEASLFKAVRDGSANYIINGSTLITIPSFSTVEMNIDGAGGFDAKVKKYNTECDSSISEIEKSILSLTDKLAQVPETVHGIYQTDTTLLDKILSEIKDDDKRDLVKFLVLNGYLDKHYQYYISYFYPNALKREDRNFVMHAGRHEGIQYDVKLERIDEVLKRFPPEDFESNTSLLNIDLVRAVYQDPKYSPYCSPICRLIAGTKNLDFVLAAYKASLPIKQSFFYQLLRTYDFWEDISSQEKDKQDDLREVYVRFCDLREGRLNLSFKEWLSHNYAFLEKRWDVITTKRILENIFKEYAPVFSVLKLKNTPENVLHDVLDNQRYDFSRQNVNAIVKKLGFYESYSSAAYTALREANVPALLRTVEKNWGKALKSVFPDTSTRESSGSLALLLNSPSIPLAEVRSYISKQRSRVKYASLLRDDVLEFAFDNSLVEASWENVYHYAVEKRKGLPLKFLYNRHIREKVGDSLSEAKEMALCRIVVFSNDIKQSEYERTVALFTTPFKEILNPIYPARIKVLIENNYLEFNEINYRAVKDKYPAFSSMFLAKNVTEFLKSPENYSVSNGDAIASLKAIETKKSKCDFIRAIARSELIPDSELVSLVYPLVDSGDIRVSELGIRLLTGIIAYAPESKRISLGRRSITSIPYQKDDITAILMAMGGEFRRLTSDSTFSTIGYSFDAMRVINELVKNEYLKGYEKRSGKIIVNKR